VHKRAEFDISCSLALASAQNEILNSVLCLIFGSFYQEKEQKRNYEKVNQFSKKHQNTKIRIWVFY